MVLRIDDFAAFNANWSPKSENLRALSAELNLPLDAFVFVDDNPAEREEVAVPFPTWPSPSSPTIQPDTCAPSTGKFYFEAVALSEEDLRRTATYQARRASQESLADSTDLGAYLDSLQMVADVDRFRPESIERVTQLIKKTNQFTSEHSAAEAYGRRADVERRLDGDHDLLRPERPCSATKDLISVLSDGFDSPCLLLGRLG